MTTLAPEPPPWALRRITLDAADADAQGRFYGDTLGLPVTGLDGGGCTGGCTAAAGATALRFRQASPGASPFYHFAFNIPPARLDDARRWLSRRVDLLTGPDGGEVVRFEAWDADALYFRDPGGNIVEFIARRTLDLRPAGDRFGPADIACVSEIGVVTPDPDAAANAIARATGARLYGQATDDFVPLGDERGVFIISRTGRPWWPTRERPAEPHPVSVGVQGPLAHGLRLDAGPVEIVQG